MSEVPEQKALPVVQFNLLLIGDSSASRAAFESLTTQKIIVTDMDGLKLMRKNDWARRHTIVVSDDPLKAIYNVSAAHTNSRGHSVTFIPETPSELIPAVHSLRDLMHSVDGTAMDVVVACGPKSELRQATKTLTQGFSGAHWPAK